MTLLFRSAGARAAAASFTFFLAGSGCHSSSAAPGATAADAEVPAMGAPPLLQLDCDPMVPTECGLPFPSSVWTIPDSTTATGVHVYFGKTTLPEWKAHTTIDPTAFADRDGFSPGAAMITHLPGATATGLPSPDTIASSVAIANGSPSSPTLLVEADTGALVPHFAELDVSNTDTTREAFLIHPMTRLKDATRYLVAIRNVVDASGQPLPANPVFAALRDNTPSSDLSVPPRRALYADITSKLAAIGVTTGDLQLAWDFTTASSQNTTGWLIHMRDDALAKVGTAGPAYTITKVEENPNPFIRRRLTGQMTVPLYLTQVAPGNNLNFGPDGLPAQNGTASFPFLVHIPNVLVNTGTSGPIVANGHGLLGDESEGEDSYLAQICDREGYVAIAVNLEGMASDDLGFIMNVLAGDISGFKLAVARQHQGILNELLAMRMMMGKLATDPQVTFNGKSVIDPTKRFYRGDSQGGIFGTTYMSISTDVTRGLLGEPGTPYDLLLDRSADFAPFFLVLRGIYPDALDVQLGLRLIQLLWDRTDPDGYVAYLDKNMLPNTPQHEVLIHAGIGDHQVTPLGAELIARTIGAQNLSTVNREVFGIPDAPSGFTGSGIVEWSFGLPPAPLTDIPMTIGTDPHGLIRYIPEAQDMADKFFRTGTVVQTCSGGGPCVSADTQAPTPVPTGSAAPAADAGAGDAGAPSEAGSDASDAAAM